MGQTRSGLNGWITRLAGWAVGIFQKVEQIGGPIPNGPALVVANHPNSLLDPLIVFRVAGRPTRPLAKAPLFQQALLGTLLRALGGLPVYRRQDDPGQTHRNDETFAAAIAALRQGDAIQIYPEGKSHSEPALAPLRTGAARIALAAEAESDWQLGLRIVPIGITYAGKSLFRGRALAMIGEPFAVSAYRDAYAADNVDAVRALTARIGAALEAVTLNLTDQDDRELIETADRLYAREKGWQHWREREELAERLPRLRFFAHGLAWLRAHDPERHERLVRSVRRYQRALTLYGAREGNVPPNYRTGDVLGYVLRQIVTIGLGLPIAALATLLWLPAWYAPRVTLAVTRPDYETIATYKLATSFFTAPLTIALCAFLAWRTAGVWAAIAALVLVPLLGLVAIAWHERWRRVREDVVVFWRALRHRRGPDRLASLRALLTAEFDALLEQIPTPPPSPTAATPDSSQRS